MGARRKGKAVRLSDLNEKQTMLLYGLMTDIREGKQLFNVQQMLMVLHGFGYTVELVFTDYHEPRWRILDDDHELGEWDSSALYTIFIGGETFIVGIPKRVQEAIGYKKREPLFPPRN